MGKQHEIHSKTGITTVIDCVGDHRCGWCQADKLIAKAASVLHALEPLVKIADAYDANELDDEARKTWGRNDEHTNTTPPEKIELYTGRGGRQLLTLGDCMAAREAVKSLSGVQ